MERALMLGFMAVLMALVAALVGGIVKAYSGAGTTEAIQAGGKAFAAALTLALMFVSTFELV